MIPGDGTVIEGIASVDESAITGESAPVIREAGGDRSAVTGSTRVLSDRIVVEITQEPGKSFLDRMIALVEGAERRKTPNEIALGILLAALTLIFMLVDRVAAPVRAVRRHRALGDDPDRAARRADPDHDRRAAVGDRDRRHGPARAPQRPGPLRPRGRGLGRRRRAAARQDRHDHARQPRGDRVHPDARRHRARSWPRPPRCPRSPTRRPEGRSIVVLAKQYGIREHDFAGHEPTFVPFTRRDPDERRRLQRHPAPQGRGRRDHRLGRRGGRQRPAAAAGRSSTGSAARAAPRWPSPATTRSWASIYLKDIVKEGMEARFDQLRAMGIRTIMVTGDNRLTAAKIAEESGVDDFLAEATPGAQARADQGAAGRRPADRDDRRRHQRRAGAGPGRRRRGDEHRHPGGARGRATWSTSTPTRRS